MEPPVGDFQRAARLARGLRVPSGAAAAIGLSALLSAASALCGIPASAGSLESSAVWRGGVQRLLAYSFVHEDAGRLLVGAAALLVLGGGLERGLGTARFLALLLTLPACAALLFVLLEPALFGRAAGGRVLGLVPAALCLQAAGVTRGPMRRAMICGVNVPSAALPWLCLLVLHLVPGDVLLCNALAVIVGQIYGKGWFALLDLSESRASLLDKKMPLKLLRKLPGAVYVPASLEERRTTHHLYKPPPGSYPVQAYAPVSSSLPTHAVGTHPQTYEGWKHSDYTPMTVHHWPGPGQGHQHSPWQTVPAQQGSSHWTHASPPAACAAGPACCAAPLHAPAGVPATTPGTPQVSRLAHGVHGLPP